MDVIARLSALVRGGAAAGIQRPVQANTESELLIAQGLPPYTEMSRRGLGWQAMDTAAIAGLVVRPSTAAGLTLFNGEQPGGKAYVIDRVWAFNLVTTAAISGYSIWGCLHPPIQMTAMTLPTADFASATIKSMSGKRMYSGAAIVDTGATVTDDGWFPLNSGTLTGGVTTAPSGAQLQNIDGRLIVPPTGAFSIHVVSTIVGLTFTHGFSWYEVALPLE